MRTDCERRRANNKEKEEKESVVQTSVSYILQNPFIILHIQGQHAHACDTQGCSNMHDRACS